MAQKEDKSTRSSRGAKDYPGRWWHSGDNGEKIHCDLCPRACVMKDGDRGFCFVRQNIGG